MIMWELYHESVPFEGDIKSCTEYTLNQDERPKIQCNKIEDEEDKDEDQTQDGRLSCSAPIADLIRKCWSTDPASRPSFSEIMDVL